jgi:hypothetical protein
MTDDQRNRAIAFITGEVREQAAYASLLRGDLDAWPGAYDNGTPGEERRLFFAVQDRLLAAGIASQLLWPGEIRSPDAAEIASWAAAVRKSFGVPDDPDDSPIGRRMHRDHLSHLIERTHRWVTATTQQAWDLQVAPAFKLALPGDPVDGQQIELHGLAPVAYMRVWAGDELVFFGDRLSLEPFLSELERLGRRAPTS